MFQPFGHVRQQAGEQIYFPTFDPGEENGDPLSPALPLNLYDLGVGTLSASKQRAAPLALRIFVEACLSVPQDKRRQGPVLLPRQTLREFLAGVKKRVREETVPAPGEETGEARESRGIQGP